jgi:hypothetical protein
MLCTLGPRLVCARRRRDEILCVFCRSLPNFHAESRYITSGVVGNFEKDMEDWPTTAYAGGKLPARTVANGIIDSVTADHDNLDCTGVVGADGVHNTGTPVIPPFTRMHLNDILPRGISGNFRPLAHSC